MPILKTGGIRRKVWLYLGPFLLLKFLSFNAVAAASPLVIAADDQYAFAQNLFEKDAYLSAVVEFRRFIHFFPDDPRRPHAMLAIGKAYARSGRYDEAIHAFQELIDRYPGNADTWAAFFDISDAYIGLNQPQEAIVTLNNLITVTDDPAVKDNAYYRMGWIAVDAGVWRDAAGVFAQLSQKFRQEHSIDALIQDTLQAETKISQKNPALAGILSIAPGAGQLYCGRYSDALSAFIVNGGLIWAAVESFENELYALGAVITVFEFGFYSANIYGAVAGAHKYNQDETRRMAQHLRKQYRVGLSPTAKNNGIMISFQYVY